MRTQTLFAVGWRARSLRGRCVRSAAASRTRVPRRLPLPPRSRAARVPAPLRAQGTRPRQVPNARRGSPSPRACAGQVETVSKKDAMQFPLIGSAVLFGLYIVIKLVKKELLDALTDAIERK